MIEIALKLTEDQTDDDTCTNFMSSATMALHGFDHGVTLAIAYPGALKVMREEKGTITPSK